MGLLIFKNPFPVHIRTDRIDRNTDKVKIAIKPYGSVRGDWKRYAISSLLARIIIPSEQSNRIVFTGGH